MSLDALAREWRRTKVLVKERSRIVELAGKLTPAERAAALAIVSDDGVRLVDLAAYLNRATRTMSEEKREAFADAAGASTKPEEIRTLIVSPDGSARFYTVEVA